MDNDKKRKISKNIHAVAPGYDNDQLGENRSADFEYGCCDNGARKKDSKKRGK